MWSDDSGVMAPEQLVWIHPRRVSYACDPGDLDPWTPRLHDPDDWESPFGGVYGTPITAFHRDKFLFHETAPLGVHRTGEGLFAGVVHFLLMYEWDLRDLMALVELLGRPPIVGYFNAGGAKAAVPAAGVVKFDGATQATDAHLKALADAIYKVSGSMRAVLADTTRVEAVKLGDRATPLQLEVARFLEGNLSKAINGTTGVTDIVAGARAAHETAWKQSLSFWRYDVRRACSVLSQLAARMVRANPGRYGLRCPTPVVWSPDLLPQNDTAATGKDATKDPA